MEKKLVKMSHPLFAGDLLQMGINFVKVETDEEYPYWDHYYYEDTQEYRDAYKKVSSLVDRYRKFMEKEI